MERGGSVYFLTNQHNTTLYTGVTSELQVRILKHQTKEDPQSFTARYNLCKLVYFENFHSIEEAIETEKQIKKWPRKRKEALINQMNPEWKDLTSEIMSWWSPFYPSLRTNEGRMSVAISWLEAVHFIFGGLPRPIGARSDGWINRRLSRPPDSRWWVYL